MKQIIHSLFLAAVCPQNAQEHMEVPLHYPVDHYNAIQLSSQEDCSEFTEDFVFRERKYLLKC